MASLFTRIIKGELPCYKIHEDELTFSFLALDQIQPGHTLVVPRREVDSFLTLPEPDYTAVFRVAQKIGQAIEKTTKCPRVGVAIQGFEVAHCHVHLIPLYSPSDFSFQRAKRLPEAEMLAVQAEIVRHLTALL